MSATDPLSAFLRGEGSAVCVEPDGRARRDGSVPRLLVPGAFNPVHAGHWGLAEVAARLVGVPAAFELSIANVDKPPLSEDEVRRRLGQFGGRAPVWLTRAPTFLEKARLFPGAAFAVGADTAERIIAPRYYGGSAEAVGGALAEVREHGCRFLVAGRVTAAGAFAELHHLDIPTALADLFGPIPAELFRLDVSSTALRAEATGGLSQRSLRG